MWLRIRWLRVDLAHAAARLVAAMGLTVLAGRLQDWAIAETWNLLDLAENAEEAFSEREAEDA